MENAHGKEQNQQSVANAHKGRVDIDNDAPYLSTLKGLRRLSDESPKLGEFFVPCSDGIFQRVDYPVVINDEYLL